MSETLNQEVRQANAWLTGMMSRYQLINDVLDGTPGMRDAGGKWLPKWPSEQTEDHEDRISQAVLFNAYAKTVRSHAGKPFSRPIGFGEKGVRSKTAEAVYEDFDQAGRDINEFFLDTFESAIAKGKAGTLVEMLGGDQERPKSAAGQRKAGIRPYAVQYDAEDVLGWRFGRTTRGLELMQLRLLETNEEETGQWGTTTVESVRVLSPGAFQVWRPETVKIGWRQYGTKWEKVKEGTTSLDYIPWVDHYTNRTGLMRARPYLEDLLYLNLTHYQSYSDQRVILHTARVPVWFAAGFQDGEDEFDSIGSGVLFSASDPAAKFQLVETSGKAIEAGEKDLEKLERMMEVMALEPLVKRRSGVTATEKKIDTSEAHSPLQMMTYRFEDTVRRVVEIMADYAGEGGESELQKWGDVDLFSDFGVDESDIETLKLIDSGRARGDFSRRTYWNELQRRKALDPNFDADSEEDAILEEPNGAPEEIDLGDDEPEAEEPELDDQEEVEAASNDS